MLMHQNYSRFKKFIFLFDIFKIYLQVRRYPLSITKQETAKLEFLFFSYRKKNFKKKHEILPIFWKRVSKFIRDRAWEQTAFQRGESDWPPQADVPESVRG